MRTLRPLAFLTAAGIGLAAGAQCPTGITYIHSQAEADAFATNYPACASLPSDLYIDGADITDLSPFDGLTRIEGTLQVTNSSLSDIDAFDQLAVVEGDLWIWQCASLTSITGFSTLDTVGTLLSLWQNNAMTTLEAFPDLDVCGVNLLISENASLTSIGGFGELDSVGTLTFSYNPLLTDISAFDHAIAIANFLEMVGNASLSPCNVQAVCDYVLDLTNTGYFIEANAPGCQSWAEVYASCISTSMDEVVAGDIALHPNPAQDVLQMEGLPPIGVDALITDQAGRSVQRLMIRGRTLDIHALTPGIYFLHVELGGHAHHLRFVRE